MAVVALAILFEDVEIVFNFIGSIASNSIGFILPCLFYWFLIKRKKQPINWKYYMSIGGVIFFIPFGIFAVVAKAIKH